MTQGPATPLIVLLANFLAPVQAWWREAQMWTIIYWGGLSAGTCAAVAFVLWRIVAARRERQRLEALVARDPAQFTTSVCGVVREGSIRQRYWAK